MRVKRRVVPITIIVTIVLTSVALAEEYTRPPLPPPDSDFALAVVSPVDHSRKVLTNYTINVVTVAPGSPLLVYIYNMSVQLTVDGVLFEYNNTIILPPENDTSTDLNETDSDLNDTLNETMRYFFPAEDTNNTDSNTTTTRIIVIDTLSQGYHYVRNSVRNATITIYVMSPQEEQAEATRYIPNMDPRRLKRVYAITASAVSVIAGYPLGIHLRAILEEKHLRKRRFEEL